MKKVMLTGIGVMVTLIMASCGGESNQQATDNQSTTPQQAEPAKAADDAKGIGSISHVELTNPLDQNMVKSGKEIYDVKCGSCHKLTGEKLVGPGWKGVTQRRKPEWIMNFTTNVEEMLNKDAAAMALLEECLVRMPNQNLTEADARNVLEFMRSNDGEK